MSRGERKPACKNLGGLLKSWIFLLALVVGLSSGFLSAALMYGDDHGYVSLEDLNPSTVVFNVFVVFASLMAAARTSHALFRYIDAAALMERQNSYWYDAVATLVAFSRTSTAPKDQIRGFQELAVRLFSLLSALCLESLEENHNPGKAPSHVFKIIGWDDLSESLQDNVMNATDKVEYTLQQIDHLVVDAVKSGIVQIAPPLLTRSFQEMGHALTTFHEAKKFSAVPLPYAYLIITRCILVTEALFVPFILAANTAGYKSAFLCTFGGTFLLWFMNGVAENLDNPFKKEANNLDVPSVQEEFNSCLLQLLQIADHPTPALSVAFLGKIRGNMPALCEADTVHNVRRSHSRKSTSSNLKSSEISREVSGISGGSASNVLATSLAEMPGQPLAGTAAEANRGGRNGAAETRRSEASATRKQEAPPAVADEQPQKPLDKPPLGAATGEQVLSLEHNRQSPSAAQEGSTGQPNATQISKKDGAASKRPDSKSRQAADPGTSSSAREGEGPSRDQLQPQPLPAGLQPAGSREDGADGGAQSAPSCLCFSSRSKSNSSKSRSKSSPPDPSLCNI